MQALGLELLANSLELLEFERSNDVDDRELTRVARHQSDALDLVALQRYANIEALVLPAIAHTPASATPFR
jgi:hypothetical protein